MFKIMARTVLELGSELISSDVIAFYELIKNGFDAGTKNGVDIRFQHRPWAVAHTESFPDNFVWRTQRRR